MEENVFSLPPKCRNNHFRALLTFLLFHRLQINSILSVKEIENQHLVVCATKTEKILAPLPECKIKSVGAIIFFSRKSILFSQIRE